MIINDVQITNHNEPGAQWWDDSERISVGENRVAAIQAAADKLKP